MDSERAGRFYDRQAPIYDLTRRLFLPGRSRAVRILDVRPGHRVVDFACGTGANLSLLRAAGATDLTGVDVSPAMLGVARRKHPDVRFVEGDVARVQLGFAADRATCAYALSLMDSWSDALTNIRRHLAPDGALVVVDFHPLEGAWRPADALLALWFRRFGVRRDLQLARALRSHFAEVRETTLFGGYGSIVWAKGPRPEESLGRGPRRGRAGC
jgi:ubiquinone/menaquinone biosynthesis C-methylase UbiE